VGSAIRQKPANVKDKTVMSRTNPLIFMIGFPLTFRDDF
jgi:hypothetical protein